jgi:hypothetical protein
MPYPDTLHGDIDCATLCNTTTIGIFLANTTDRPSPTIRKKKHVHASVAKIVFSLVGLENYKFFFDEFIDCIVHVLFRGL